MRRHERIHLQNVRIAAGARRHHFDGKIGIPFLCACDDEGCGEFVVVPLNAFEEASRARMIPIAHGHVVAGATRVADEDEYELVRVPNGRSQTA